MSPQPSITPRSEAEQIVVLTQELVWSRLKIQALEERLRLEMIRKYGPKSETLSEAQFLLLELEPGVSVAEVEAEAAREPLPPVSPLKAKSRTKGKHPGRQDLPARLPRVEKIVVCTPEQCVCKACGQATVAQHLNQQSVGCRINRGVFAVDFQMNLHEPSLHRG